MDNEKIALTKFGANVRKKRNLKEFSQEELADLANLDRTYVGGIERGERNLTILSALKLCGPLGCSLSNLVEGVE
ncbi:MAG: helix-turn-helix domain-containing protein [Bacteroidota bacterium]